MPDSAAAARIDHGAADPMHGPMQMRGQGCREPHRFPLSGMLLAIIPESGRASTAACAAGDPFAPSWHPRVRPQPRCSTGARGAPTATALPRARSISCMTRSAIGCSTGSTWSTAILPTCSISARATAPSPAGCATRPGTTRVVMAEPAARFLARASGARVAADPELVPFRDASFDLVVSNLVLHWTADLPGALVQLRRALRPDGLLLAAMLGGQTLIELRTALFEAELERGRRGQPARVAFDRTRRRRRAVTARRAMRCRSPTARRSRSPTPIRWR